MKYFVYILIFSFTFACGVSKKTEESKINPEIMWDEMETFPDTAVIDLTKRKVFHASKTILTDLIHTKLEVSFDWQKSWLMGIATISAKPHFYDSDSLILDAKGMEIKSVELQNKPLNYSYDGSFLRIKLDKIYNRNQNYIVQINYIAKPDERKTNANTSEAITNDRGLYFINPKGEDKSVMPQIWTQGETESNSVWFPTIDATNIKMTQEILITVDKKYNTLSNGKLIKSITNANGTRTDHWKQDLPHAPYLAMMGVGEFKIVKDFYTHPNGTKMEVNYYVESEWEKYAKSIFGETPAMIKFFSELTGIEYPWDKYHQIVVRNYVSGAMENTGAVVFGDFVYKTDRELLDENDQSVIAHELFHHWFGDLVTCESWSNLPLNESFANYSQYLWDEHRYGLDEADYQAENEKYGYYNSENDGRHNLIWYDYQDRNQMFDAHSYNKGGRILHMLRNHLGDQAFFEGLKLYLKTNQFKAVEFHQLRLAFEEVSGQDLNWFFQQWFEASGYPILNVEQVYSKEKGELILTVTQNQDLSNTPLYYLPVEIIVFDDAGEHKHKIVIDEVKKSFTFTVSGNLKNVLFDNQQCILGKIEEKKPQEQFIHQYYNGKRYLARKNALASGTDQVTPEAQKMILDALNDPFWNIRLLAIEKSNLLSPPNLPLVMEKMKHIVKSDKKSDVRAEALRFLAQNITASDFEDLCVNILDHDSSYLVIGMALNQLSTKNKLLALQKAKKLENENSSKLITGIAELYALNGGDEYFPFFEKLMRNNKIKGYHNLIFLQSFSVYMSRQNIDIQEKALDLYKIQHEKGDIYVKMFLPQNINYLVQTIETSLNENKKKLESSEKNKDYLEIENIHKKIKKQESVIKELNMFLSQLEISGDKK